MYGKIKYHNDEFMPVKWIKSDDIDFREAIIKILESTGINLREFEFGEKNYISIKAEKDSFVLGYEFKNNKNDILIDCVYSEEDTILSQQLMPDYELIKDFSYYVLVTNSSISPKQYFEIKNHVESTKCEFVLIDQYFLYFYFKKQNKKWGKISPNIEKCKDTFSIAMLDVEIKDRRMITSFILIRNYDSEKQNVSISTGFNQNYEFSEKVGTECILNPNGSYIFRFPVKQKIPGSNNDVFFIQANIGNRIVPLEIPWNIPTSEFTSDFYGGKYKNIVYNLCDKLGKCDEILYLFGEAGIGKSRIIKELYNYGLSKKSKLINFEIPLKNEEDKAFINKIRDEIKKECRAGEDWAKNVNTFTELIKECKNNNFDSLPIIVLDNFHNVKKSFLKEIKNLIDEKNFKKVKIIIIGRNDFSAGSIDYHTFRALCEKQPTCYIVGNLIDGNLTNNESKSLLKSMLPPQFPIRKKIIEKICGLSKNNPLFIIQYAQYLIDGPLGNSLIKNLKIKQKEFISENLPEEINEIYEARFKYLKSALNARYDAVMLALFAMATKDMEINHSFVESLIDYSEINLLIDRKLLLGNEYNYRFAHETILLYLRNYILKNQKIHIEIANIFVNNTNYLNMLEDREKGKMFCWRGDYSTAFEYFKDDIKNIGEFREFSSTNVNEKIYEYIDDIVEILSQKNSKEKDLISNALLLKIYIALHYKTPYKVIVDYEAMEKVLKEKSPANLAITLNNAKVLKAHAYMNCSQYKRAEQTYSELIGDLIVNKKAFSAEALFDMYDRLASLYTFYNQPRLAEKYIERCVKENNKENNKEKKANSFALIELTKGKLYFFDNPRKTSECIKRIKELENYNEISNRLKCHIDLTEAITDVVLNGWEKTDEAKKTAEKIEETALRNSFTFSIVRVYNFLSILNYFKEKKEEPALFEKTIDYAEKGIGACIDYGTEGELYYFYNTLALVFIRQNNDNMALKYINAMFNALRNQDLLYVGSDQLCYGNILALNNIAKFLLRIPEKFYKNLGQVNLEGQLTGCDIGCENSFCQHDCIIKKNKQLEGWFKRISNNQPIIMKSIPKYFLYEGYYILIM